MSNKFFLLSFIVIPLFAGAGYTVVKNFSSLPVTPRQIPTDSTRWIHFPREIHLQNTRQLTFGAENAEAYWSFDGEKLTFQRTDNQQFHCDQIFWGTVPPDTLSSFQYTLESTGKGRTTCSFFLPGDSLILYASTHATQDTCPPVPDQVKIGKYVWPVYNSYEIYVSDLKGNIKRQLTKNKFYDAEGTVSPKGDKIIFTSDRNGDLDLYEMNPDGSNVMRITNKPGYDGGGCFSPDGSKIVWRASRPKNFEEKWEYRELLKQGMVAPTQMQVYVANADGSDVHQVTHLPGANWAPCFTPDGKKILFASNYEYPHGFPFSLYLINLDGTGLEKVTYSGRFDAFPMFSPDGKRLVWCSMRNGRSPHEINIFVADWIP
ncbi:MAG TPA: hypothetical protein VE978_11140 [Chitinophagales bacterium]|nr:hypothetical protein [Chitinophagales bacterium]